MFQEPGKGGQQEGGLRSKMPPKKSNLNNARNREAQRKRVARAHQLAEQITVRNAAQRIREVVEYTPAKNQLKENSSITELSNNMIKDELLDDSSCEEAYDSSSDASPALPVNSIQTNKMDRCAKTSLVGKPRDSPMGESSSKKNSQGTPKGRERPKRRRKLLELRRRRQKRLESIDAVLKELNQRHWMKEEDWNHLSTMSSNYDVLLTKQLRNDENSPNPLYSNELKTFAITLHYYSSRAYNYIRNNFSTCLPHPRTINKWYKKVDSMSDE